MKLSKLKVLVDNALEDNGDMDIEVSLDVSNGQTDFDHRLYGDVLELINHGKNYSIACELKEDNWTTRRKDFVFLEQRIDVLNIGEAEKFNRFLIGDTIEEQFWLLKKDFPDYIPIGVCFDESVTKMIGTYAYRPMVMEDNDGNRIWIHIPYLDWFEYYKGEKHTVETQKLTIPVQGGSMSIEVEKPEEGFEVYNRETNRRYTVYARLKNTKLPLNHYDIESNFASYEDAFDFMRLLNVESKYATLFCITYERQKDGSYKEVK